MLARGLRLATVLAAAVLVLLVLLMAGLWWWSGTEGSLGWVLHRIGQTQPLQAEGVRGSLRSGLRVQKIVWERGGLRVEAHDVLLEWQPTALVTRTVQLDEFRAGLVRVIDHRPPSADPPKPPANLTLPLRAKAGKVSVARLEWLGRVSVEAQDLAGGYGFDGLGHQLRLDSLRVAGGRYRGEASLSARDAMPLETTVQGTLTASVPRSTATIPLSLNASLKGPLADLRAHAVLHVVQPSGTGQPQATATARITPFAAMPVAEAQADLRDLDLGALWPKAPHSRLSGHVALQPAAAQAWRFTGDLRNAAAGPWDARQLPVEHVVAQGEWRSGMLLVQELRAQLGGGSVQAQGRWREGGWTLDAKLRQLNLQALHSKMAAQPVGGQAQVSQDARGIDFDAALQAQGPAQRSKPARKSANAARALAALELREAKARGRWSDGTLALPAVDLRTSDAHLQGALTLRPESWAGSGRVQLDAPGLAARVNGNISETAGRGSLQVDGRDLGQVQGWLRRLPVAMPWLDDWRTTGRANAQLAWQGGWRDPAIQGELAAPSLALRPTAQGSTPASAWTLQETRLAANGRLSDARLELRSRAEQGQRRFGVDMAGRGGRSGPADAAVWRAQLPRLALSAQDGALGPGVWRLDARRALSVRWLARPGQLELDAGEALLTAPPSASATATATATVSQAVLAWQPTRWGGGALQTAGRLSGLPMAWLELLGGQQLAGSGLAGNLVFDAQWDANLGRVPRLNASIVRRGGDVNVLADSVDGGARRVAAGVRDARLTLAGQGENLTLALRWDSERAGNADVRLVTRLAPGGAAGWHWPGNAPLGGFVRAQLPRIGVWSLLAPPGWRLRGALAADVALGGTRDHPRFNGRLAADDLALRSVVEGVELRNGRLRAQLEGQRLRVDEFVLHGAGEGAAEGSVVARGEGAWTAQGPQLNAVVQLTRLRASIRSDRDITVSGEVAARVDASGTDLRGRLVVDRARIVLPEESPPRLGQDVVVRRAEGNMATAEERKQREPERPPPKRALQLAVDLDLGEDFRLQGRGLNTRLAGTLALTGQSLAQPQLVGTIQTSRGEYRAYGQWLEIERGVMRFNGPLDNPALDVLAIRPHIAQRVGVQISGTAQSPFIRLYSEPDLPEAEKLTWLVTGRAAPSGGAEAALVQQAAMALLSRRGGGATGGIAGRVGLDELSVRRDTTEGAVVTLGKRFAQNFYAAYERSLSGTLGTLYIFYDVSRRLTLRAETGERTAVDLIFTFQFDRVRR